MARRRKQAVAPRTSAQSRRVPESVLRRIFQALQHTGRDPSERAQWLIAFANADLSASTDADVERWQWEIMAWSLGDPRGLDIEREFTEVFAFTLSPLLPQLDLLTLREEVQRTLRTYLGALVDTGEVSFGNYQGELVVKLRADGTGHRRVLGSAVIQFFNRVSEVFEKFGSRLRVCDPPACEKYVAAVGHYRYCSPACSQRVRTRRHEQKKRQTAPPRRRAAG